MTVGIRSQIEIIGKANTLIVHYQLSIINLHVEGEWNK